MICDTPGLEDTRGPELDLSNMYGICIAAKACKTIVPVIVLSKKGCGDRMTELKRICHNISHFFKDIDDVSDKFHFLFTGFVNRANEDTPISEEQRLKI